MLVAIPNLQEFRDLFIIIASGIMAVLLTVMLVFTIVIGLTTRSLMRTLQTLIKGEVTPALETLRDLLRNARGTTVFIGEAAVTPIVRVYGAVAGARRVLAVITGFTNRRGAGR